MSPSTNCQSAARRLGAVALATALLSGCASTAIDANFTEAQRLSRERLGAELKWLNTAQARQQAQEEVDAALAHPLTADDAVRVALAYSPALQAALADGAAASAAVTQSARLPNPVFSFERLARGDGDLRDLDISRALSVSLLDVLLLPARMRQADHRQQQVRLQLAAGVTRAASAARVAWVQAVAAQQALGYFEQVKVAAEAGAELARRMQAVGNFSKLQRAREQAFHAQAAAQLARAQHSARSTRETLVRALGLTGNQVATLKLPERLPDLPQVPSDEPLTQAALTSRLDVAIAQAELEFVARDLGLTRVTSVVNSLHVDAARVSQTGQAPQQGYALELALPVFDLGDARRAQAQATYMAALNRTAAIGVEAASQLREAHAGYRSAYDLARHYRNEVVPLRKAIADESLLRYNGMLIGVFELLADTREQIASVVQAIDAQRDFWLADAALQAAVIGAPMALANLDAGPATGAQPAGH